MNTKLGLTYEDILLNKLRNDQFIQYKNKLQEIELKNKIKKIVHKELKKIIKK